MHFKLPRNPYAVDKEFTCEWCGINFVRRVYPSDVKPVKFCSQSHRSKSAWEKRRATLEADND